MLRQAALWNQCRTVELMRGAAVQDLAAFRFAALVSALHG